MYTFFVVVILIAMVVIVLLNLPVFGRTPKGQRLAKIKALSLYHSGAIQNQSPTPTLPPDVSYWTMLKKVIKGNPKGVPENELPHLVPNFERSDELKLTWFGHSSYLIQVDGLNILVDPVFSERPSPFQFIGTKRFKGTDFVRPEDLPELDMILLTHDHYDHLDYRTILALKSRTKQFLTSLGVGEHLEYWGVAKEKIQELSWHEQYLTGTLAFTALPARHFSGRKFKRNQTLWSSFLLQTKAHRLYLGGDSGFDTHFKEIGETYGPFDLAILECGQYNDMWPLIHLAPEEVVEASLALNAAVLMPVHWGKFRLALHDWDEPIRRLSAAAAAKHITLVTPMLGETFNLKDKMPDAAWWLHVQ